MNNMRHRILAIFVSILMVCSFLPLQVLADEAGFSIESDKFTPATRAVSGGREYLEYNSTWRLNSENATNRAGTRLFIVIPDSSSTFDFDEWAQIAENDSADLLVCLPRQDQPWNESDYDYLVSVYTAGTSGYRTEGASKHIAAYGDGGIPASLFAVQRTANIATVALVDADVADISGAAKTNLPLAVLLINAKSDPRTTAFVDYFKASNEADEVDDNGGLDRIYYRGGSSEWNPDYSKSHFVRTLGGQSGPVGQIIYDDLFHRVGRWTTIPNENTLRPRAWPDEVEGWEVIKEDAQLVNGTAINREASVYVPSKVRSGEITGSIPIVMLFHGISANGAYHTDQTDWYKTAEENNFILYAPTGYNHTWSNAVSPTGASVNDLSYFSGKIDEFTTTGINVKGDVYKIDPARVYLTGFSMGGGFVTAMAMRYPEKIAAVAPLASASNGVGAGDRVAGALPFWFTIGSADSTNGSHPQAVSYFLYQAGVIPADNITNVAGINAIEEKEIKNYSAYGQDDRVTVQVFTSGSVEIRYAVANNIAHGIMNEYADYIWGDFFSRYEKVNGESVLRNELEISYSEFTPDVKTTGGRQYLEYVSSWHKTNTRAGSRLFIVLPDSSGTFDFDEWARIAENDKGDLLVGLPKEGKAWDESDYDYLVSLYGVGTTGSRTEGASKFIAAYGDGGIPASLFAVQRTFNIAAVSLIDAEVADISGAAKVNLPLAVMMINAKDDANTTAFADYFKAANETDESSVQANDTTYYRSGSSAWNPDYSKSHFVRMISGKAGDIGSFVFEELFHRVGRWTTIPNENTLRPRAWPDEVEGWEVIGETAQLVNGTPIAREASVYIPSKVRDGSITGPVPIVMLFHGVSANGAYHTDQTDWYKTAEKNDFILYAPTAYNFGWSTARTTIDELGYFAGKIDEFASTGISVSSGTYKIDPSRVYITGFSSGGNFVTGLMMSYPEKIAAAAPFASAGGGVAADLRVQKAVPLWLSIGDKDSLYGNANHTDTLNFYMGLAGTDKDTKTTKNYSAYGQDDRLKVDIYTTGSVEIRYGVAENLAHGIMNEYADYVWDDFFSRYEKVNGESVLIEDMSDGKVRVSLGGSAALTIKDEAEYILSVANANKLATVTVWFEVDGTYLNSRAAEGLNGFSVINGINWVNTEDSTWVGRVTLGNLGGSLTESAYTDILNMSFGLKELGVTTVKITRVELSGYDQDGQAIPFAYVIRNGAVETKIAQHYSVYDLNRDEKVDQIDLTIAQKYYAARETDDDWDVSKIADVDEDGDVDIADLILILNNIIW